MPHSLCRAFHESVDVYLDGCRQDGEQPERPCSGRFVVRTPADVHWRASTLARIKEESLNAVVVEALEEFLSHHGV